MGVEAHGRMLVLQAPTCRPRQPTITRGAVLAPFYPALHWHSAFCDLVWYMPLHTWSAILHPIGRCPWGPSCQSWQETAQARKGSPSQVASIVNACTIDHAQPLPISLPVAIQALQGSCGRPFEQMIPSRPLSSRLTDEEAPHLPYDHHAGSQGTASPECRQRPANIVCRPLYILVLCCDTHGSEVTWIVGVGRVVAHGASGISSATASALEAFGLPCRYIVCVYAKSVALECGAARLAVLWVDAKEGACHVACLVGGPQRQ